MDIMDIFEKSWDVDKIYNQCKEEVDLMFSFSSVTRVFLLSSSGFFDGYKEPPTLDNYYVIMDQFYNIYSSKEFVKLPFRWDQKVINSPAGYSIRKLGIVTTGFALLNREVIEALTSFIGNGAVLEVMAGSGFLSYQLQHYGVNVKTVDDLSWCCWNRARKYVDIENIDAVEAVKKYGKDTDYILVSWAPMDNTCYDVLMEMRKQNPNAKMIYIGEFGDCCASNDFTSEANICDIKLHCKLQNWWGIHDSIYIVN